MDLITQAVLGAAVGQAGFYKKLNKRAIAWGAIIATMPDLDVMVRLSNNPFAHMIHHRGITHALWFCVLLAPCVGYGIWRYHKRDSRLDHWMWLSFWALITHPLLDLFTIYGTQLLAPFSYYRFALPGVSVVDPVYTLILLAAIILGWLSKKLPQIRQWYAQIALGVTTIYLFLGLYQNHVAEQFAIKQLAQSKISYKAINVYPTFLQIFYRRIVVRENDNKIRIGFISTIKPTNVHWHIINQSANIDSAQFLKNPGVKNFIWFCNADFSMHFDAQKKVVQMRDLRFGVDEYSLEGPWGIEFMVNSQGEILSNIQYKTFKVTSNIKKRIRLLLVRTLCGF